MKEGKMMMPKMAGMMKQAMDMNKHPMKKDMPPKKMKKM